MKISTENVLKSPNRKSGPRSQLPVSEVSAKAQKQPLLCMCSEHIGKIATNAAKSPKSEAFNVKST